MDKLIRILFENPILLLVVGAWVFGAISSAANKAKNKQGASDRGERRRRRKRTVENDALVQRPLPASSTQLPQRRPAPVGQRGPANKPAPGSGRLAGSAAQSPEQIAREMRRILGLEPAEPAAPPPRPPSPPPLERPPEPIPVTTASRVLGTQVDSHVGERMRDRHMSESLVGKPRAGRGAIGNLGGRVTPQKRAAASGSRFSLDDLRKAIVLSEILSPPVSVRSHEDRHPT